jgi:hypothetical protein
MFVIPFISALLPERLFKSCALNFNVMPSFIKILTSGFGKRQLVCMIRDFEHSILRVHGE